MKARCAWCCRTASSIPAIAADLFHRYLRRMEARRRARLRHHGQRASRTATCMSSTVVVTLSILARETKRARLLVLGYPIGHRPDPLRCAEELATIDVVSRGRLEMGFVKGVPYEIPVANTNPVFMMDRFWEAHDFIIKAMTSHDAPVQLGGRAFPLSPRQHLAAPLAAAASAGVEHHQQPHQARVLGERGYVMATLGSGYNTRRALRCLSRGLHVEGPTRHAAGRPLRLSRRWSRSRATRPRRAGAASWSRAIRAPPRSSRRRSAIRRDSSRSRTMRSSCKARRPPRSFTKDGTRHRHGDGERAGADRRRHHVLRHARPGLRPDRRFHRALRRARQLS